jgi:DNA-binding response OmpR family regulator
VEDDPDYRQLLSEAFLEAGFRTLLASNGEQALDTLRAEPVDLVVSDFIMPELNGLELCRLLAEDVRLSKLKVILYSCNTDQNFRRKARDLGAIDYLPKTDDTESLVRQVCQLAGMAATATAAAVGAARNGDQIPDDRLRSLAQQASRLKVLFDSLQDFTRILALGEQQTPAARLAWEAVQRTGAEIRRILEEMEAVSAAPPPQTRTSEMVSR